MSVPLPIFISPPAPLIVPAKAGGGELSAPMVSVVVANAPSSTVLWSAPLNEPIVWLLSFSDNVELAVVSETEELGESTWDRIHCRA